MHKLDEYISCQYCENFTGDDSTGCAGKIQNGKYQCCRHFFMDRFLAPREVYQAWKYGMQDEW